MLLTATMYLRVLRPMRFPVAATTGEYIAVMPPIVAQNLWVHEASGLWVVRRGHFPEDKLWTVLYDLQCDGTLAFIHSPLSDALPHPLPADDVSPPRALRLLRSG